MQKSHACPSRLVTAGGGGHNWAYCGRIITEGERSSRAPGPLPDRFDRSPGCRVIICAFALLALFVCVFLRRGVRDFWLVYWMCVISAKVDWKCVGIAFRLFPVVLMGFSEGNSINQVCCTFGYLLLRRGRFLSFSVLTSVVLRTIDRNEWSLHDVGYFDKRCL